VGHQHYQLRTVQLGNEAAAVVFDATDSDHTAVVHELLAAAPRLHAHSATADLVPLAPVMPVEESQGTQGPAVYSPDPFGPPKATPCYPQLNPDGDP